METTMIQHFDRWNAVLCIFGLERALTQEEQALMSEQASSFGRDSEDAEKDKNPKYYIEFREGGRQIVFHQHRGTPAPTLNQFRDGLLKELGLEFPNTPSTPTITTSPSMAPLPARSNTSRSTSRRVAP
jgi:hypothetical protein